MSFDEDLTLKQGSTPWLRARNRRIGGSEIGIIMRVSPYKTRRQLWEEKTGRKEIKSISHLPHVKRGIEAEPVARSLLEIKHGVVYSAPVLKHPRHSQMVASLDGLCELHTLEIKTMSLERHLEARLGQVPEHYLMQCQWGLLMAKKNQCLFASFRPEDGSLYECWIQGDYILQRQMLAQALIFWRWVERDQPPPEDFELIL